MAVYPWISTSEMLEAKQKRAGLITVVAERLRTDGEAKGFCGLARIMNSGDYEVDGGNYYRLNFDRALIVVKFDIIYEDKVELEVWIESTGGENYGFVSRQLSTLLGVEPERKANGTAYWEVVRD